MASVLLADSQTSGQLSAHDSTLVSVAFKPSPDTGPIPEIGKVPPKRLGNESVRSREYLTPAETENLMQASRKVGRHGHRDATLLLIAYRHGFRVSELVSRRWDQVHLTAGLIHINRLKNGRASSRPLPVPELRALRKLSRDCPYVFTTERKGPMTASNARKIVAKAGRLAGIPFPVHPHMLRHGCGYKLANDGQDTLNTWGIRILPTTVRYTELAADRFNWFWKD